MGEECGGRPLTPASLSPSLSPMCVHIPRRLRFDVTKLQVVAARTTRQTAKNTPKTYRNATALWWRTREQRQTAPTEEKAITVCFCVGWVGGRFCARVALFRGN